MLLHEKLKQIGFTDNEAKIYIELLKIGPQGASILAKRAGLNRSTSYSIIKSLVKKGLICSYKSGNVKRYMANDPNVLVAYLDRQQRKFEYNRSQILTAIPYIRSIQSAFDFRKPVVSYFEGVRGVMHVMYDALEEKDVVFYCYLSIDKWLKFGYEDSLISYKNSRISKKKMKLKALTPDTPEVRAFFDKNYNMNDGYTEVVYVKDRSMWGIFDSEMNIYGDKVALLHFDKGEEYGVMIESREIAAMQRHIFQIVWDGFNR
ncbi:hypothetical protein JKY72_03905 [Candidatus Gracilibacteria bacterium]|nr:hypothetical protein [Candidatus Gracilibacteria bacterium]